MNDLRFAFRQLLKNPSFTAVAVLTLALGIGANTAIFSVVNGVLLSPLPYNEPDRLVQVISGYRKSGADSAWLSVPDLQEMRRVEGLFERVAAYGFQTLIDLNGDEPIALFGAAVLPETFNALGVQPLFGRVFVEEERVAGRDQVILLSHDYWRQRFNGDPNIVGTVLRFKDRSYEVVGVMPPAFSFPDTSLVKNESRFWVPLAFSDRVLHQRTSFSHQMVARLKPGTTIEQAQAMVDALAVRLAGEFPSSNRDRIFRLMPLHQYLVKSVQRTMWILFGAVSLVLLIACANVANLLLARAAARQHEVAVRASLGAGRWRLMRQSFIESLLLSVLGCLAGVVLAHWSLDALRLLLPANMPRPAEIEVDATVLAFSVAISFLTALLVGLFPAIQFSNPNLTDKLKDTAISSSTAPARSRARSALMTFETALAFVLLMAAGLLMKSFWVLQNVDLGFNPGNVLTVTVTPPAQRTNSNQVNGYFSELKERLGAVPGIMSVGFVDALPLSGMNANYSFRIEGEDQNPSHSTDRRVISGDYFQAMRIPLLRGRFLEPTDTTASPMVVVISEAMAKKFWAGKDPVGQRIKIESPQWVEIVGIVGNVKHSGPEAHERPELYVPLSQARELRQSGGYLQLVARTSVNPRQVETQVRREILSINPLWPVDKITSIDRMLRGLTASRRFNMVLVGLFGGLAVLLAAIGIYGITSYTVVQRTREIGIRMALGAQRFQVMKLMLRQVMAITLAGLAIGAVAALISSRVIVALLFRISPTDATTFVSVFASLFLVALAASWLPTRRATKIHPMEALRYE
jgi:putative ABC transport system permease protein